MQTKTTYKATGIVLGDYWGGGSGSFRAESYTSDDFADLTNRILKDIETGAIDSGMGYQKVKGALMTIEIIETVMIDGKEFTNSTFEDQFFGDLSDDDCEYLTSLKF